MTRAVPSDTEPLKRWKARILHAADLPEAGETAPAVVGVIGGMGPEATVEFFRRVVRATPAHRDQEHLRVLIDNHPQIPDRVEAILGAGPSPLPAMVESARLLERAGADLLAVPCNTAHLFLSELRDSVGIPVLDMVNETVRWLHGRLESGEKVGLLATAVTLASGLYQDRLEEASLGWLLPTPAERERLTGLILRLKAGRPVEALRPALLSLIDGMRDEGADAVVMGCTELSVILAGAAAPIPVADSTEILARATVREAFCKG